MAQNERKAQFPRAPLGIACPATGSVVIPDAAMLTMTAVTPISCPACAADHAWDPKRRRFLADAPK